MCTLTAEGEKENRDDFINQGKEGLGLPCQSFTFEACPPNPVLSLNHAP